MRREGRVHRGGGRSITGQWSHLLADDPDELGDVRRESRAPTGVDAGSPARRRSTTTSSSTSADAPSPPERFRSPIRAAPAISSRPSGCRPPPWTPPAAAGTSSRCGRERRSRRSGTGSTKRPPTPSRSASCGPLTCDGATGGTSPEPRNVGIACGPSGLVVLDLDLAKPGQDRTRWPVQWRDHDVSSGADVLAVLAEQVGQSVPETYVVATPSGGRHLYFAAPEGRAGAQLHGPSRADDRRPRQGRLCGRRRLPAPPASRSRRRRRRDRRAGLPPDSTTSIRPNFPAG